MLIFRLQVFSLLYAVLSLSFCTVHMLRFDMNFVKFRVMFFFFFFFVSMRKNVLFNIRVAHINRNNQHKMTRRPSFINRHKNTEGRGKWSKLAWRTTPWTRPRLFGEKLRLPHKGVKRPCRKASLIVLHIFYRWLIEVHGVSR